MPDSLADVVARRDRAVRALADHLQAGGTGTCPGCHECQVLREWLDWTEGQVALATTRNQAAS